jgi:hypothetical protein
MHVPIFFLFFFSLFNIFILIDKMTVVTIQEFSNARTSLVNPISAMLVSFLTLPSQELVR